MKAYNHSLNDPFADLHPLDREHRDACALICSVRKGGQATHGNVKRTIEALDDGWGIAPATSTARATASAS